MRIEPPLNSHRGDGFSDCEYLQADDSVLKAKRQKALLQKLLDQAG